MQKRLFYLLSIFILTPLFTNAQSTNLTGTIFDGEYNDVLPFASVVVKGTETGAISDFEGDFQLALEEGTYTIVFSFVGYETKEISDVVITKGDVTELDVTLNISTGMLDEVVISTSLRRNTE